MINNGTLHYDHDVDGVPTAIAGCRASFRARDSETLVAIRYQNNRLTVSTDIEGDNTWKECFTIDNVHLPTMYYFGFTAATGELTDHHDIISVQMYQLETSEERMNENRRDIVPSGPSPNITTYVKDQSNMFSWSKLLSFISIIIIFLTIAIGVYYYTKYRLQSKRRLY
jgi:lectin, mannose-binding 2